MRSVKLGCALTCLVFKAIFATQQGVVPNFVLGNCAGAPDLPYVVLAKLAHETGALQRFVNPSLDVQGNDLANFTVSINNVPSCGFVDEMDGILTFLRGSPEYAAADAIVGCDCSGGTTILGRLVEVPLISGAASSDALSSGIYPLFMRTIPPDAVQASCQVQLMLHNGWQSVAFLYMQNDVYASGLSVQVREQLDVQAASGWRILSVLDKQTLNVPSDLTTLDLTLVRASIAESFPHGELWHRVISFNSDNSARILRYIYFFEMMQYGVISDNSVVIGGDTMCTVSEFNYIVDELHLWRQAALGTSHAGYFDAPFWDEPGRALSGALCTAPDVRSAWLAPGTTFASWLSTLTTEQFHQAGAPAHLALPTLEEMRESSYGPLVFDSAVTVLLGISDLLKRNISPHLVNKGLFIEMLRQAFQGMSGPVSYDDRGERFGTYLVKNLQVRSDTSLSMMPVFAYTVVNANVASFDLIEGASAVFANGQSTLDDVLKCHGGFFASVSVFEGGLRTEVCRRCEPGTVRTWGSLSLVCEPCPARQFANESGSDECLACPKGHFNDASGAETCTPCAPGKASAELGQSTCIACRPGMYASDPASIECSACEVGRYQEDAQATICTECPAGKGTFSTYSRYASDCRCLAGNYTTASGECVPQPAGRSCGFNSALEDCPCLPGLRASGHDNTCVECETHLHCPGGHVLEADNASLSHRIDDTVLIEEGYMTLPDDPYSVYSCVSDRVCEGRRSPFALEAPLRICQEDVQILARCGRCKDDFYGQAEHGCVPCASTDKEWFILKIVGAVVISLLIVLYLYCRLNKEPPEGAITGGCVMNVLQSLQTIGQLQVDWSHSWQVLFNTLDFIFTTGGLMEALQIRAECPVGHKYLMRLMLELASPLLVFLDFSLMYLGAFVLRKRLHWAYVHNIIGLVFTQLFITIVRASLSLFYREHMPNGKIMVNFAPELEFLSSEWLGVLPYCAVATVLYGVTTVVYIIYLVMIAPKQAAVNDQFMEKVEFAFGPFRPDRHWWILVQLTYALALSMIQVIAPASSVHAKVYLLLMGIIIFVVSEFKAKPFKYASNNAVDIAFNSLLIVLLIVASSLVPADVVSPAELKRFTETYANVVLVGFALCSAWAGYRILLWAWGAMQQEGVLQGSRAQLGWQFRDCTMGVMMISDGELMRRLAACGDHDLKRLKMATETMISMLFGAQLHNNPFRQRIMPLEPLKMWNYEEMQLGVWEKIETGEFAQKVSMSYRARAWVMKMAIAVAQGNFRNASSEDDGHTNTSSIRNVLQRGASATSARDMRRIASKTTLRRNNAPPHVSQMTRLLCGGDEPLSKEDFKARVKNAFPDLSIPAEDVEAIFNFVDIDNEQLVRKQNFAVTLNALVPAWMLNTMLGHTMVPTRSSNRTSLRRSFGLPHTNSQRSSDHDKARITTVLARMIAADGCQSYGTQHHHRPSSTPPESSKVHLESVIFPSSDRDSRRDSRLQLPTKTHEEQLHKYCLDDDDVEFI